MTNINLTNEIIAQGIQNGKSAAISETANLEKTDDQNIAKPSLSIDEIVSLALQLEFVLGARAFEHNGTVVIATLTSPFYLKSERDRAKEQISEELQSALDTQNIVVTFDMQVFRNIYGELDAEQKQWLTELAKNR